MDAAIKEQLAERMLPEAALWTLLRASERQGREDLVRFYANELTTVILQKRKAAEMQNAGGGPGGPPGAPGGPPPTTVGPPGINPAVMPNAMMGVPPPMPTPQGGPLVPPGTPRPGAQGGI